MTEIIESFSSELGEGRGIPLGNLTSQIFANIYLNKLDQFVKHKLKIKYYIRYADDFIILADSTQVYKYTSILVKFLKKELKLELHPDKIILRKLKHGIDFLGYIILPHVLLPKTKTKRRIFRKIAIKVSENKSGKISDFSLNQTMQSYLGYFSHANSYKLTIKLKNCIF